MSQVLQAFSPRRSPSQSGAALIIVLAFVVIITGVIIAFFTRSIFNHQASNGSASQTKADLFAQGATDAIISDLQQEIIAGSSNAGTAASPVYVPSSPTTAVPALSGSIAGMGANILKRSAGGVPFYAGSSYSFSAPNRAAIGLSSTIPSINGRAMTPGRWNAPLLVSSTAADFSPATSGANLLPIPDWILASRNGTNPMAWSNSLVASATNSQSVVGRYAYIIYNEGGLLDMNVAGYPADPGTTGTPTTFAYKNALAMADLTQLGLTQAQVNSIVGWRNYATLQTSGSSAPNLSGTFPNYTVSGTSILSPYYSYAVENPNGFLEIGATSTYNNESDRPFATRQELIRLLLHGVATASKASTFQPFLQYMGTFSRDLNQPSLVPPANRPLIQAGTGGNNAAGGDNIINPAILAVRVTGTFTRNDGSIAQVGDPLVKKRFALSRLAWITYRGPSANNMSDPVIQQSITGLGGNPSNTSDPIYQLVSQGNAANIYNYFGLSWVPDPNNSGSYEWVYSHEGTTPLASAAAAPASISIRTLGPGTYPVSAKNREADFVELLKAGLCVGSLGKAYAVTTSTSGTPAYYEANRDQSVDTQITQIVANIIDQFKADSYPARILNNFTGTPQEVRGVEDLPYLYSVRQGNLMLQDSNPASASDPQVTGSSTQKSNGAGVVMEEPCIWNPHAWNSGASGIVTSARPTNFRAIALTANPLGAATSNISLSACWRPYYNPGVYTYSTPTTAAPLTAANTELDFSIPTGDTYLFREPTLLIKPGIPSGSNLKAGTSNTIYSIPGGDSGYLTSGTSAPQYTNNGVTDNLEYLGFVVSGTSTLPVSWVVTSLAGSSVSSGNPVTTSTGIVPTEYFATASGNAVTYRLQYQDPIDTNNYLTYDEKFAPFSCANSYNTWNSTSAGYGWAFLGGNTTNGAGGLIGSDLQVTCFDPRTSRFGMLYAGPNGLRGSAAEDMPVMRRSYNAPYATIYTAGWASSVGTIANNANSASQNATWTDRPDEYQGATFGNYTPASNDFYCHDTGPLALGWYPARRGQRQ